MKYFFVIIYLLSLCSFVHAADKQRFHAQTVVPQNTRGSFLSPQEIERVKACRELLKEIDSKTLQQTIDELEKTSYPQANLKMMEAMAMTYADIVREKNVEGKKKKEWLYSMIELNMAYLQFGAVHGGKGDAEPLNRLIRWKLKEHLPPDLLKQPGVFYPLE